MADSEDFNRGMVMVDSKSLDQLIKKEKEAYLKFVETDKGLEKARKAFCLAETAWRTSCRMVVDMAQRIRSEMK